jgi:hypothetical protein
MTSTEDRSANGKFSLLECSAVKLEDDRSPSEGSLPNECFSPLGLWLAGLITSHQDVAQMGCGPLRSRNEEARS